jgi:hypothetical protein
MFYSREDIYDAFLNRHNYYLACHPALATLTHISERKFQKTLYAWAVGHKGDRQMINTLTDKERDVMERLQLA